MTALKRGPLWVFSFALFPLGLGVCALGTGDILEGRRSLAWPAVEGKILSSTLSESLLAPARPEIRYAYTFEGRPYVSNMIWPGGILALLPVARRATAERLVERFPEGARVPVHVNPRQPGSAVLIAGPGKAYRWMAVFTTFVMIAVWSPLAIGRFIRGRTDPDSGNGGV